jgi:hypothetical protein
MPKQTTFANDIVKLFFQGVGIAGLADNAATSPVTNIYVSLHTANPGAGGTQATTEAAYTGYARVAVPRTTGGWSVTSGVASPVATINFPAATGGSETEAFFGVGTAISGAGKLLYPGSLNPSIVVSSGVQPQLTTATSISET